MTIEEQLKASVCFCEATDFERQSFWTLYHEAYEWKEGGQGTLSYVGYIGKRSRRRDVYVQFYCVSIKGMWICFYTPTSRYVDYTMIEQYIKNRYTNVHLSEANQFHNSIRLLSAKFGK